MIVNIFFIIIVLLIIYLCAIFFLLRKAHYYQELAIKEEFRLARQQRLESAFDYCNKSSLSIGDYLLFKSKSEQYFNLFNKLTLGIFNYE